ncbi:hypothetical protein LTR62_008488 [Meristemomyces frigidus]|uniref:A-pheromone processing metallopeptidase Ste23 n=1 Tax=Meristemomyces frigidus TaxID=1508187 RepID=A0AAN7YIK2_9PEZI|nr:hypothetical protein LTR62_008488 [Meristemomyces frigidus]
MAELPLRSQIHSGGVTRLADHLEKPLLDTRSYRVVKLSNELEALLIHDPETDKASGAMDVNVGAFSDSDDLPGMAHAVEHLLFMGTEKYPVENEYNQYLNKYGGSSNAYTAACSTNYYFELSASAESKSAGNSLNASKESLPLSISKGQSPLYGALDRFAQFFVKPLFLEDTLDRELRAVDSENKKNLQSDPWREMQLHKSLCNKAHPFNKFSTGNYEVLHDDPIARGVKIRDAFIGFYEEHYSANRMKLAILGKESLDQLQEWAVELFSDVPNQSLKKLRWDDIPLYGDEQVGTQTFFKPVMDKRKMELFFSYPDETEQYDSMPSRYLSHLIGHEGPGSILALIKAKGWCNGLSAGAHEVCPGASYFGIGVQLTEDGLKNYKEIIKIVFNYIAMLKEQQPHRWIFEEMSKLQEVDFKFREKIPASRTTSMFSQVMQKPVPREQIMSSQSLLRTFDPAGIKRGLKHLDPDNFRFFVVSKDQETDSKEKWYGTDYKYEKIPADFMQELKRAAEASASERPAELFLPGKNEFVPQRLDVEKKEDVEPTLAPVLIRNTNSVRTWFKKDDRFWVPRANINVHMRTPLLSVTPLTSLTAHLYKELVEDALNEYAYDAELAGLEYSLSPHSQGFDVSISGYNDKMHVLLEKVLVTMRDLEVKPERFEVVKERLGRGFKNIQYADPYRQVSTFSRWLISEKTWLSEQYVDELDNVTAEDVKAFYPQILRQLFVEILVHGNLYKEDALRITDLVLNTLKPVPLPPSQWQTKRMLVPRWGTDAVYQRNLINPEQVNHCIDYHLFIGANIDYTMRAKLLLLAQMTSEPVFDQLRSKEQLGYVVSSGGVFQGTLAGFRFLIQSERDCDYLESRIEAWLVEYAKTLQEMSHDDFEAHRVGLVNRRLETLKNLNQETGRFWLHVTSEVYDFELVSKDVPEIEALTKEDMLEFYHTYFHPSSTTRAKVAVHLIAQASAEDVAKDVDPKEQRTKLATTLAQVLQQIGMTVDPTTLADKFEKADITDPASITATLKTYLESDALASEEQLATLTQQAPIVLAQILPQLGIKAKGPDTAKEVKEVKVEKKNQTVYLEDVKAWKASLPLSAGPKAVKELSAFEELDAKL